MSAPVIELRAVSRTYPGPPPVTALGRCDLNIARGDYVAVVGPSGSGKSTWLNLVGLLDRPTEGTYLLDGVDTTKISEARRTALRAARIGFVFQTFHLLHHRNAVENVMLGQLYRGIPRRDRMRGALAMLERVGLSSRVHAMTGQLSGGEQQRVAIARALVSEPSLLLCDEPTGNLDSVSARRVLDLMSEVHRAGQTVVVVTHDNDVAAQAQRLVTIRDGVLAAEPARNETPAASQ